MVNPTRRSTGSSLRSLSPVKFYTSSSSQTSSFFQNRSSSPTRINLYGSSSPSNSLSSVRFSIDNRSISVSPRGNNQTAGKKQLQTPKRMCMCSPTSHPGSFRCNLHKNSDNHTNTPSYPSNRLNARRSAMTNSLVRIGTVEGGDLVKRALSALIRPSSHQQRRRTSFQRTPSRLSVMITADDL
ncbi:uncharacterized protein [Rutidosis leptorrhynchoides]|uniref:uncharacterized protein n=1 Tax=Rutidosis leptorrhynchoides TaxID=125765 RepID=UPI003A993669